MQKNICRALEGGKARLFRCSVRKNKKMHTGRSAMLCALRGRASFAALTAALSSFPAHAAIQDQEQDGDPTEVIVVTGSVIRGVAPVGSNLVSVGQADIESIAATNVSELTNTVPAITTAGSAPQGQNAWSYYSPQIHSIGGSGSNTTLVISDGMRIPGGGTQFAQTDPNILPTSAIERVEVLADGASSIYGSDAVAGVVNYITRSSFSGLQLNGKVSVGDSYNARDASMIAGTSWGSGDGYIAASYLYQSEVSTADRPFMSRGDYRDMGGTNEQTYFCSPATIRTAGGGSGNVFLSPDALEPIAADQANAPCNNMIYGAAIPSQMRANLMARVNQDVTDRLSLRGTLVYNYLEGERQAAPGVLNNATVFGSGAGRPDQVNPFYRAPVGDPDATQQTVGWLALRDDDDYGREISGNQTIYLIGVADYRLTDEWSISLSNAMGRSVSHQNTEDVFCISCALLALNGTTNPAGNPETPSVGGTDIRALNLPLTPENALDVWNPVGSSQTSDAVLRDLYAQSSENTHTNWFNQTKVELQGPVFQLPAGLLRMAVGAEYYTVTQDVEARTPNNTGPTFQGATLRNFHMDRNVWSAYAEVMIPVVSPDMEVPLVYSFDLNVSGRYDKYSDVGSTANPKFAVNWSPSHWLRFRGNYSESFVAPALYGIGYPEHGYARGNAAGASVMSSIVVPLSVHPEAAQIPGADCSAGSSCVIGLAGNVGLQRSFGAGLHNVVPQTGRGWSLGFDLEPDFLPGFTSNITYWSTAFRGGVATPALGAVVSNPNLRDRLTLCPSGCTQEQVEEFTRVRYGASLTAALPETVYFLYQGDTGNLLNLDVEGIDYQFQYQFETDNHGIIHIGTSGTYYTRYDQNIGGAPNFSVLNTSGANNQFPNLQWRTRSNFGWEYDAWRINTFVNWTASYRNWSSTTVEPLIVGEHGPIGGGDKVDADLTVDLNVAYEFPSTFGYGDRAQVYLNVVNVFDEEPPFYNGNTQGVGVGSWGFNGYVSNPIGRLVSVGARLSF
jgi:iron complex outermembrane recepter protein